MDIFRSPVVPVIIFSLGIVNIISAFLILSTCRCIPASRLGAKLMKYQAFKRFYKVHCYIWDVFWPSVIIHAFLAIMFFGSPF